MALTRKDEARALDRDEQGLVEKSHHPALKALDDAALLELSNLMRQRRDRAQTLARQQRRELRGKAVAKGATPTTGDAGARLKHEVLAKAVRRLNAERERRGRQTASHG